MQIQSESKQYFMDVGITPIQSGLMHEQYTSVVRAAVQPDYTVPLSFGRGSILDRLHNFWSD